MNTFCSYSHTLIGFNTDPPGSETLVPTYLPYAAWWPLCWATMCWLKRTSPPSTPGSSPSWTIRWVTSSLLHQFHGTYLFFFYIRVHTSVLNYWFPYGLVILLVLLSPPIVGQKKVMQHWMIKKSSHHLVISYSSFYSIFLILM